MLKGVKRYVRERFERTVISKPDNIIKPKRVPCCKYKASFFPDYLKCVNQNFSSQYLVLKHSTAKEQSNDSSDKFKSSRCLDPSWVETFGLSGTLAFGWSLSQNVELKRKRLVDEILSLHYSNSYPLKSALCPYTAVKFVLPKHVLTQPNEFLQSKFDGNKTELPLRVFGPLTAEEALNEAKIGLEKARNAAIAEFENRMGLRCMSQRRYRRAMAHFAAGSALQSDAATFNLAQCYELGLGTPKDLAKAAKCYLASSELGNATATFNLAVYYAQGLGGLKSDKNEARRLLEKAVDLGEPHAKVVMESRMKRQETKKKEPDGKNKKVSVLGEPVANKKVAPFLKIGVDKVTETNQNKSIPVSVMTKTCADGKFKGNPAVSDRSNKSLTEFPLLDVKGYKENIPKLPVAFEEPVLPRNEFGCGIPLVLNFCARKVNTVQGQ